MNRPMGWFHIVLNFMGNIMRIYLDGVVRSTLPILSSSYVRGDGRIVIGRRFSELDSNYPSAQVDELLFFNRALNETEVTALFSAD